MNNLKEKLNQTKIEETKFILNSSHGVSRGLSWGYATLGVWSTMGMGSVILSDR